MEMIDRTGIAFDGFDLALRFGELPTGSLVARKLIETRILTVASPGYIERNGRPKHPSEVAHLPCIDFYDAVNARPFEWEFRNYREVLPVKPASRLMVSDVGAMFSACEAGVGIAQIMQLGSSHLIESGRLVDLFPPWPGELFLLYALSEKSPLCTTLTKILMASNRSIATTHAHLRVCPASLSAPTAKSTNARTFAARYCREGSVARELGLGQPAVSKQTFKSLLDPISNRDH
jgi:DNA-binding transcriptional LysR family regulator